MQTLLHFAAFARTSRETGELVALSRCEVHLLSYAMVAFQ
jgi:hypothetical protein